MPRSPTPAEIELAPHLAWKVRRDPFYASAGAHGGSLDRLIEAGFFDDGLEPGELHLDRIDHRWLTTPVHKLHVGGAASRSGDRPVVLLTTGGFSPVHDGHLEMMGLARTTLAAAGREVIGGYLSPSHDSYVSTKDAGRAARHAEDRLLLCEEAVRGSDWLMVDPWEARSVGVAINYTDVLLRLEAYLAVHVPGDAPEVAYVFGGDNAGFARAFIERGLCVCIPRPGCEAQALEVASEPGIIGNPRIHIAERSTAPGAVPPAPTPAVTAAISISSSAIRAGGQAHVPSGVAALIAREAARAQAGASVFAVRDDLAWACAPWADRVAPDRLAPAAAAWRDEVLATLADAFAGTDIRIECYNIDAQADHVAMLAGAGRVLDLDPCTATAATGTLAPARLFAISDGQRDAISTVGRPGHPPLDEQLAAIPPGECTLVDDDVATGATIATIRARLAATVRVAGVVSLLDWSRAQAGAVDELHDFADLRDFLVGARDAGLVVELPDGSIGRAPYLLPYVSPASRLTMPPAAAVPFSTRVWEANARFFDALPVALRAGDADPATAPLWVTIAMPPDTPLAAVCRWHATRLRELPFSRTRSPGSRR